MLSRFGATEASLCPIAIARWTLYLVTGQDELATIFTHHVRVLEKGPGMDGDNPLIGRGLLLSETPWWETSRREVKGALAPRQVKLQRATMEDTIDKVLDGWPAGDLDLFPKLVWLTAAVVVSSLFEVSLESETFAAMIDASRKLMEFFYRRTRSFIRPAYWAPWPLNRQFHEAAHILNDTADQLYAQKDIAASEFLQSLQHLSVGDRRAQIITFLIAGHETTANALAWTLDQLARNPEAQRMARQDATWLDASIDEALRLYPPIWLMSRKTLVPMHFGSQELPAGSFILMSPWVSHRLKQNFADPEIFSPQRWIDQPAPKPYTYFPFGAGQRSCIGESFARQEIRLTVQRVLSRWNLVPLSTIPTKPDPRMSLRPLGGIPVRLLTHSRD